MWICSIYKDRPKQCREYPLATSFIPESCGFSFLGNGERRGRCEPECEATCCRLPRMDGEPTGAALPEAAGGKPCKYLVWTETEVRFGDEDVVPAPGQPSPQPDDADSEL